MHIVAAQMLLCSVLLVLAAGSGVQALVRAALWVWLLAQFGPWLLGLPKAIRSARNHEPLAWTEILPPWLDIVPGIVALLVLTGRLGLPLVRVALGLGILYLILGLVVLNERRLLGPSVFGSRPTDDTADST